MRRIALLLVFVCVHCYAQKTVEEEAIMQVAGVMQMEDVGAEEVERLMELVRRPVRINHAERRELEATGLFTPFQIASLLDYRERHGDIMSVTELSVVDGFNRQAVSALKCFLSFEADAIGRSAMRPLHGEINARTSVRIQEGNKPEWKYGLKGKMAFGDLLKLSFSAFAPSATVAWQSGKVSLVAGDFNARFGQGLCLWNTTVIGGLTSPSSYMRRPSGISPSYSFSNTYSQSGIAGSLGLGNWNLTGLLHVPGIRVGDFSQLSPALNLTRYFRFGHISLTNCGSFSDIGSGYYRIPSLKSSVDASFCFNGVNVFGEAMYDYVEATPSVIAGFESSLGEKTSMASLVRYLPSSDEHGWAASLESKGKRHTFLVSNDVLYHPSGKSLDEGRAVQVKTQAKWKWVVCDWLSTELRITERYRTWGQAYHTDARVDLLADAGPVQITSRFNVLMCKGTGLLGSIDVQYKMNAAFKVYLRQGIFRIDNWDDRIYVYERDAPGNFNVPAFYGRGIWTSAYVSWRFARWGSLYSRISYKKPGRAELKLQCILHF